MEKDFELFLSQLQVTNRSLDFFVDFDKASLNIEKISIKLNQLNYLLGQEDLKKSVEILFQENPKCFNILNMLIAVRSKKEKAIRSIDDLEPISLEQFFSSPSEVYDFLKRTGLEAIFKNKKISNIHDYVFGIEVGLDSNARKNRVGKIMEQMVRICFRDNQIRFKEQVNCKKLPKAIASALGKDAKVFDFFIQTKKNTYLIEANFFNGGGSKLNEVSRAYIRTNTAINSLENYIFVWITDGIGWLSAKSKLQEAYNQIDYLYNLQTLDSFIEQLRLENIIEPE